jgi:hypothetical protein
MYFDVGFFGLPYGDSINTTKIVYDPAIVIYHIPEKTAITWILIPIFTAVVAIMLVTIYIIKVKKLSKN